MHQGGASFPCSPMGWGWKRSSGLRPFPTGVSESQCNERTYIHLQTTPFRKTRQEYYLFFKILMELKWKEERECIQLLKCLRKVPKLLHPISWPYYWELRWGLHSSSNESPIWIWVPGDLMHLAGIKVQLGDSSLPTGHIFFPTIWC